jgi:aspartyl aminopeptidase
MAKTERKAVELTVSMRVIKGFRAFDPRVQYKSANKIFYKTAARRSSSSPSAHEQLEKGLRIVASHIDRPAST